jgi:hypothetical protein
VGVAPVADFAGVAAGDTAFLTAEAWLSFVGIYINSVSLAGILAPSARREDPARAATHPAHTAAAGLRAGIVARAMLSSGRGWENASAASAKNVQTPRTRKSLCLAPLTVPHGAERQSQQVPPSCLQPRRLCRGLRARLWNASTLCHKVRSEFVSSRTVVFYALLKDTLWNTSTEFLSARPCFGFILGLLTGEVRQEKRRNSK